MIIEQKSSHVVLWLEIFSFRRDVEPGSLEQHQEAEQQKSLGLHLAAVLTWSEVKLPQSSSRRSRDPAPASQHQGHHQRIRQRPAFKLRWG